MVILIDMITSEEYAAVGGEICPGCGSKMEHNQAYCYQCGSRWIQTFRRVVTGYIDFKPGPDVAPPLDFSMDDET